MCSYNTSTFHYSLFIFKTSLYYIFHINYWNYNTYLNLKKPNKFRKEIQHNMFVFSVHPITNIQSKIDGLTSTFNYS